jgi:hypothetical protein
VLIYDASETHPLDALIDRSWRLRVGYVRSSRALARGVLETIDACHQVGSPIDRMQLNQISIVREFIMVLLR